MAEGLETKKKQQVYKHNKNDVLLGYVYDASGRVQETLIYSFANRAVYVITGGLFRTTEGASGQPISAIHQTVNEIFDHDTNFRPPKRVVHAVFNALGTLGNRVTAAIHDADMYRKEYERIYHEYAKLMNAQQGANVDKPPTAKRRTATAF